METGPTDSAVRERMDSKFRYVLIVAERAEQLMRGARAKLDLGGAKPTRVAQAEIDRELVDWDYGLAPIEEAEQILEAAAQEAAAAGEESDAADAGEEASEEGEAGVH